MEINVSVENLDNIRLIHPIQKSYFASYDSYHLQIEFKDNNALKMFMKIQQGVTESSGIYNSSARVKEFKEYSAISSLIINPVRALSN